MCQSLKTTRKQKRIRQPLLLGARTARNKYECLAQKNPETFENSPAVSTSLWSLLYVIINIVHTNIPT